MPGFDGTGPMGQGSMTGRGLGPCGQGQAFRRGIGRCFFRQGRGSGLGRGFRRNAPVTTPIDASDYGDTRIDELASRLERIESMLESVTKSQP